MRRARACLRACAGLRCSYNEMSLPCNSSLLAGPDAMTLLMSQSSFGTVSGFIAGRKLSQIVTQQDFRELLDREWPQLPDSVREPIVQAIVVRPDLEEQLILPAGQLVDYCQAVQLWGAQLLAASLKLDTPCYVSQDLERTLAAASPCSSAPRAVLAAGLAQVGPGRLWQGQHAESSFQSGAPRGLRPPCAATHGAPQRSVPVLWGLQVCGR